MSQSAPQPQPNKLVQPKFGGLPPNAVSQFGLDLLGVWAPKIPLARSKEQLAEDAFLENIENGAFYFAIPLAAPSIAKGLSSLHGLTTGLDAAGRKAFIQKVGSSWSTLGQDYLAKHAGTVAGRNLLGAKFATLIGVLSFAGGYEYMIQHAKNVMIAKGFGTKNFTAVAGLEERQNQAVAGEMDPVEKAKKRTWQVLSVMGAGFGLAAATPFLVKSVPAYQKLAQKVMTVCNFSNSKDAFFDITKPLLALIAGIGAVSYVDAARDSLERKETGSRLALVIPYMLFGKELAGNALAKAVGLLQVKDGDTVRHIDDIISLTKGGFKDAVSQACKKESFLQLDMTKGADALKKELADKKVSKAVTDAILLRHKVFIKYGSLGLSALVCGLGINWMSYHQTNKRHEKQEVEKQKKMVTLQPAQPAQGRTVFQSYGGFAAQGKPLEDPASAAAIAAPKVQAPFLGVRQSTNSYGYGQWRI